MYVCMHECMYVLCMYACIHVCMYLSMHEYVCIYLCFNIFVYEGLCVCARTHALDIHTCIIPSDPLLYTFEMS